MNLTGTLTFLFTDIEGSTKLSQEFPDTLSTALEKHHSILRNALESNNGFIFEIVGDAFCCAFENADDAVNAAVDIQNVLSNEKWDDAMIKVRIGIHSGNAEWNGSRYMGYITLARTSRVMSAAYGEQILISNDAYELLINHKDTKIQRTNESDIDFLRLKNFEINFRDLGERRLKDVIQPIRLFQIVALGLREEFPPLKTLDARPNNLPVQLTSFIGREKDMKIVKNLLKQCPLLTLTGTGGAGKTRLALQTAADLIDDFNNGVWFVDLAAVIDKYLLPQVFLTAIGITEVATATPEETLKEYLTDKDILIIIDNCEHLLDACAELTERLLSSCSGLKIIATSREALNCSGEQTFSIPSLSNPDLNSKVTPEQLTQSESARLFIERALSVKPDFRVTIKNAHSLAEICTSLDGVPLAIELAAARIKSLSVEKIHEKLDDRFNLLTGGKRTALPRQQTLRALIDWSYDLLTNEEKILWSRLTVFSGGWTAETAEEVCSDELINKNIILDLLCQLTEKSIIIFDDSAERYRMLESIKQYGKEKLIDKNEINLNHLDFYLKLAEETEPQLNGNKTKNSLDKLESDHNNFQSAIEWGIKNNNTEKAAREAIALCMFWDKRGYYTTARRLLEVIFDKKSELSILSKTKILTWSGYFVELIGKINEAQNYFEESLELAKKAGDKLGTAHSLLSLGDHTYSQGNYELAVSYCEESLKISREIENNPGISSTLLTLGNIATSRSEYKSALNYYEDALSISKESENINGIASCLMNIGNLYLFQGDNESAMKYLEESLVLSKEMGDRRGIIYSLVNLGNIETSFGNNQKAQKYLEESLVLSRELDDKRGIAFSLINIGNIIFSDKDYELANKYYEECLGISRKIGENRLTAHSLQSIGSTAYAQKDFENSLDLYKECLLIYSEADDSRYVVNSIIYLSRIFLIYKKYSKTVTLISAAVSALESLDLLLENEVKIILDEIIIELHKKISKVEYDEYWEDGKKMTLEEAVQLAVNS